MAKVLQRATICIEVVNGVAESCMVNYDVVDSVDAELKKLAGLDLGVAGAIGTAANALATAAVDAIEAAEGI